MATHRSLTGVGARDEAVREDDPARDQIPLHHLIINFAIALLLWALIVLAVKVEFFA